MKLCNLCQIEKPISEYYLVKGRPRNLCKICWYKKCREWKCSNTRKVSELNAKEYQKRKQNYRKKHLKEKFNITIEQYNQMLDKQNGVCVICKMNKENNGKNLAVDHCHKTGKIRALLCHNCNSALGHLREDINILKNCIDYLEKYNNG